MQETLAAKLLRQPSGNWNSFEPKCAGLKCCYFKQKNLRQNDEGLVLKDSREFRGPVELFLAAVAEWDGDVVRLVLAA